MSYGLMLCNVGHEEICFVGRKCPLCAAIGELEHLRLEAEGKED